jgi:SAM-dependent methyltransferase
MPGYYATKLAAERLRACYEVAPPRARAYLEAEIEFVLEHVSPQMRVLELGCGHGRVLGRAASAARLGIGIDTSIASLCLARRGLGRSGSIGLAAMDAAALGLRDGSFDLTICVQNGISAFGADRRRLFAEAVRVTRCGGIVLFSTYSPRFWPHRLAWFEAQAAAGLIGPIDWSATRDGTIVCTDGFRASTVGAEEFRALATGVGLEARITEVNGSSVFCEMVVPERRNGRP